MLWAGIVVTVNFGLPVSMSITGSLILNHAHGLHRTDPVSYVSRAAIPCSCSDAVKQGHSFVASLYSLTVEDTTLFTSWTPTLLASYQPVVRLQQGHHSQTKMAWYRHISFLLPLLHTWCMAI